MRRLATFVALFLLAYPAAVHGQAQGPAPRPPARAERPAASSPGFMASAGRAIADAWITSKAKAKLIADRRITRAVNVETHAGVVTLRGKVASRGEKRRAEQVVHGTSGVRAVRSSLQIVPDSQRKAVDARDKTIKRSIEARIEQEAMLGGADIHVRSDNGVVTLTGWVSSVRASARANALAKAANGVQAVRNELRTPR